MIKFNYMIAILGIVGEFAAVLPKNAVMQDIFFGIFCLGGAVIILANSGRFSEKMGISSKIPEDRGTEKKAIIVECIVIAAAALIEVLLFVFHLPYTYTFTVIGIIASIMVSRIWRGKPS